MRALIGAAWRESVKDDASRTYLRGVLDLGVLGTLKCRVVENAVSENKEAPTHLVFHSPAGGGDDVRIGALWPYKNERTGGSYLLGHLDLATLKVVELVGGAKVDLRLVGTRIPIRLSELRDRTNDKAPTHHFWRLTHRKREAVELAGSSSASAVAGPAKTEADNSGEVAAI